MLVTIGQVRIACQLIQDLCEDKITLAEFQGAVKWLFPERSLFEESEEGYEKLSKL